MLPPRLLALPLVPLFLMAGIAQAQAADNPVLRSVSSLSIRAVDVNIVNSTGCSMTARIGTGKRYATRTLYPGESFNYSGTGLPVVDNVTGASMRSGQDCAVPMIAIGVFTSPQIGPPFCVCSFDSANWTEGFSVNQARAVAGRGVGLRVQRKADSSRFENFTMTASGNSEKPSLGVRVEPE